MNSIAKDWDSRAKRKLDICSSLRGGIDFVVKESGRVGNVLGLNGKGVLLDVCCGDGTITNRLASSVQKVIGLDMSSELIVRGKREAKETGLTNINYVNSEASKIPLVNDYFDTTISLSAFHYFQSYDYADDVVKELLRVTKPSGKILITEVPSKDTIWYGIWELMRNRDRSKAPADFIEFEKMRLFERMVARTGLVFRRFTGKRVDSDEWLWYSKDYFKRFEGGKFKEIKIFSSQSDAKINYRFDVLISNK